MSSELKNSFHTELAIGILLNDEPDIETKCDMLTAIGLASSNEEVFKICEKFRDRICSEEVEKVGIDDIPPVYKRATHGDSGNEECSKAYGAK